jgi:esterase/lipase superfamily enzyme
MATSSGESSQTPAVGQMIRVRFATNRNWVGNHDLFGSDFRNASDGSLYVTGTIDVYHRGGSPHPNWCPDRNSLHIDPTPKAASSSILEAVSAAPSTSDAMTAFIEDPVQAEANGKKIVFLHGFATKFIDAMSCSAEICSAYGANDVFCFSWPSLGVFGLHEYFKDRGSAYESGSAIALSLSVAFSKFLSIEKSSRPNLHIVCHSMGNRALSAAVQNISISAPKLLSENYFEYALLMAADEDYDALDEHNKLKPLLTLATNIDVYTNEVDLAMFLSGIANLHPPLGSFGPFNFSKLPSEVIWIDCTDVGNTHKNDGSSDFGHFYFRRSERVIADVSQVLLGTAPDKIMPRIPDHRFLKRKFVIPFGLDSAWARNRGYKISDAQ